MEVAVNYKLYDDESNIKTEGEAKATFDERYLTLTVMFGEPMLFAYTDIVGISDYDYKVDLFLTSKEKLNLWGLGYQYEDFLFQLYKLRNELMLKYLLIDESLLKGGFEAQFNLINPNGQTNQTGKCEIRLYDTAMVVLPQKSDPIRLPYCYITNVNKQDYTLKITNEFLEKIEFTQTRTKLRSTRKSPLRCYKQNDPQNTGKHKRTNSRSNSTRFEQNSITDERWASSKKKRNRITVTRLLATLGKENRRSRYN